MGKIFLNVYINSLVDANNNLAGYLIQVEDITEKKIAEHNLLRSERKYRMLFENMMNGFALHEIILDENSNPINYKFLEVNSAFEKLTGLDRHDIINKMVTDVLPGIEKEPENWIETYGKIALNGGEIRFEEYSRNLRKWFSILAFSPQEGYFATLLEDITEKKRIAQELNRSEKRFRELAELLPQSVFEMDTKGYFSFANRAAFESFGYEVTELKGLNVFQLFIPEEKPRISENIQRKLTGEPIQNHEYTALRKGGTEFSILLYSSPIIEDNKSVGIRGIALDITYLKQTEKKLKETEVAMRSLINSVSDYLFMIERDGTIKIANEALSHRFGIPMNKLIGSNAFHLLSGDVIIHWKKYVEEAFESGVSQMFYNHRDNRDIENRLYPVKGDKKVKYLTIFGRDITKDKQYEKTIKENEERYRTLFEQVPSGISVFHVINDGEDFVFVDFNKTAEKIEKIPKEKLVGKRVTEVFPGVKEFGAFEIFQRVWKTGKPEYQIGLYKDGHNPGSWRENWIYRLPSGNIVSFYNDITERKQIEAEKKLAMVALSQSEEKYRRLFTEMNEGFTLNEIICDRKGRPVDYMTLDINKSIEQLLNVKKEDIVGKNASHFLSHEELKRWLNIFGPVALEGKSTYYEMYSPGNKKYFSGNAYCPEIGRFAVTFTDITNSKKWLKSLKTNEKLLKKQMHLNKTLLDAIPCVAMLCKPVTREIVASNKAAIEAGAVPGKKCYESWMNKKEPCTWCLAPELWKTQEIQHQEVKHKETVMDAHWIPISIDLYMHFAFDVTKHKEIEQKLIDYQNNLKSLASKLTAAEVTQNRKIAERLHDSVSQSLSLSLIQIRRLQKSMNLDNAESTDFICRTIAEANENIRNLTFELATPTLDELGLDAAISEMIEELFRNNREINCIYSNNTESVKINHNLGLLLFRAVRELLTNVIKHANAGEVKIDIQNGEDNIKITVSDNGVGFNTNEIGLTLQRSGGFGIFNIREQIEYVGGNLEITSKPGRGSRFVMIVPLKTIKNLEMELFDGDKNITCR